MTCIVGLMENGKVYIGADKSSSCGGVIRKTALNKVFKKGSYIIGYTTSFRMGQLLEHVIELPEPPEAGADLHFMVSSFVEKIRKDFKGYGFSTVDNNEETGGTFLVGVNRKIFKINSDYQVGLYEDNFACCGSGEEYAEAVMEALKDIVSPKERIAKAIKIAGKFVMSVTQDCVILEN